jgi:hypothetical protein
MEALKMSKDKALKILEQHGLLPTTPCAFYEDGTPDWTSTFYAMLGNRKAYSFKAVLNWLGY